MSSVAKSNLKTTPIQKSPSSLTGKRRAILEFINQQLNERGFPPSVREIGEAVGLASSSSVHAHLANLQKNGFLRRHPTKPRAIEVCWDPGSDSVLERRPTRYVPLVGEVAAGTDVLAEENLEELLPLPQDLTGPGQLFMLRVRGESMIDAGILNGDFVVVDKEASTTEGDIVVAGINDGEATVKKLYRTEDRIILEPANSTMTPMTLPPEEVTIYGKVVTVLRRL